MADLKDLAQHYLRAEIPKSRIVLNSMDLFNVDGVDISMIALKTAFKSITTELKKILTELRFGLQIPDNWKPLVDEKPGNEEPTFSGVKVDSKALISYLFGNPDLGALFLSFYYFPSFSFFFPSFFLLFSFFLFFFFLFFLLELSSRSPKNTEKKYFNSSTKQWKERALQDYLEKSKRYNLLLMTAIHLVSGQPARATELETMTWANHNVMGIRSIFFSHGKADFFSSKQNKTKQIKKQNDFFLKTTTNSNTDLEIRNNNDVSKIP